MTEDALGRACALEEHVESLYHEASAALVNARHFQMQFNYGYVLVCRLGLCLNGSIRRAMAEMIFQGAAAQNVLRFAPKLCQILGHSRLSAVETARCQSKCLGMKCKTSKVAVQVL
jgi:hypothetical protein